MLTAGTLRACWSLGLAFVGPGVLAGLTGPRAAIALAGLLMLATPLLLPWKERAPRPEPDLAGAPASSGTS